MKIRIDMGYYFSLDDLKREMMDSCFYSQRFESLLTFKLDSLRELCGRLPDENEIFFIYAFIIFTSITEYFIYSLSRFTTMFTIILYKMSYYIIL